MQTSHTCTYTCIYIFYSVYSIFIVPLVFPLVFCCQAKRMEENLVEILWPRAMKLVANLTRLRPGLLLIFLQNCACQVNFRFFAKQVSSLGKLIVGLGPASKNNQYKHTFFFYWWINLHLLLLSCIMWFKIYCKISSYLKISSIFLCWHN